jgi:ribosomal protein L40E
MVASCKCGKQIKAKPEFAGKRIKCPSCGDVLQLPRDVQQQINPVADLLDEIGYENASKDTCPECKSNLPAEAVLCVQCGYHLSKGKRLSTKRIEKRA